VCILDVVHRFSAADDRRDGFKYTVGICDVALRDTSESGSLIATAGAVQVHKDKIPNADSRTHAIGSIEQTEIMSGSEFGHMLLVLNEYFRTNSMTLPSAILHQSSWLTYLLKVFCFTDFVLLEFCFFYSFKYCIFMLFCVKTTGYCWSTKVEKVFTVTALRKESAR